ncbi:MAGa7180 family putative nuclease [Mycoplasma sp. 128]
METTELREKLLASFPRKYYNDRHYTLDEEKRIVILEPFFHNMLFKNEPGSFAGFKKIGGSSIAKVLNTDVFNNHFQAFCHISRLALPMLDPKYVNAGVILEPKIIAKLAREAKVEVQTFNAREYKYDYFADKNKYVGGIPDGFIESKNTVVEIKTAGVKKWEEWKKNGPSLAYIKQAQLYAYLMGAEKFGIFALFLEEEDYQDPNKVDVNKRHALANIYPLDEKQARDDLEYVINWFKKTTINGFSEHYDPVIDADQIDYLRCRNENDWAKLLLKWYENGKVVIRDK